MKSRNLQASSWRTGWNPIRHFVDLDLLPLGLLITRISNPALVTSRGALEKSLAGSAGRPEAKETCKQKPRAARCNWMQLPPLLIPP